jgi:hypothetical protein
VYPRNRYPRRKSLVFLGSVKDSLNVLLYESKIQVEETKTLRRQSLRVQWLLFFVFVVAGIYAEIARLQKKTMDATLGQIQKQVAAAEISNNLARRSLQSAIDSERPWAGITFRIQDWTVGSNASATAIFTNSGRRPAKISRIQFDSNEYVVFPDSPRYRRNYTNSLPIYRVSCCPPSWAVALGSDACQY